MVDVGHADACGRPTGQPDDVVALVRGRGTHEHPRPAGVSSTTTSVSLSARWARGGRISSTAAGCPARTGRNARHPFGTSRTTATDSTTSPTTPSTTQATAAAVAHGPPTTGMPAGSTP